MIPFCFKCLSFSADFYYFWHHNHCVFLSTSKFLWHLCTCAQVCEFDEILDNISLFVQMQYVFLKEKTNANFYRVPPSHFFFLCSHSPFILALLPLSSLLVPCYKRFWKLEIVLFIYLFIYYSYVHTMLGSFLPPPLTPSPSPAHPLDTWQKLFCPYLWFCWWENISNNRKEQEFLLVRNCPF
jgi:hypothetical protein